jgi:GMP synthase-like glutamine amidotransferase
VRVVAVVHQRDTGPGVFAAAVAAHGATLDEWHVPESPAPAAGAHQAAIVLGGAMNTFEEAAHPWLVTEKAWLGDLLARGVPILGVCLGAQLLAEVAGGEVRRAAEPEIGWRDVSVEPAGSQDPVLSGLPERFEAFEWHSYEAVAPAGSTTLARSAVCPQAYRLPGRASWGLQFHAEVDRPTAEGWIEGYEVDSDAVRIGLDPRALAAQTRDCIAGWNELGSDICTRFLAAATATAPRRATPA